MNIFQDDTHQQWWRDTAIYARPEPPPLKFCRNVVFTGDDYFPPWALGELCETLCEADLHGRPVYATVASALPARLVPNRRRMLAFTSRNLDAVISACFKDDRGRGVGIVINDSLIRDYAVHFVETEQEIDGVANAYMRLATGATLHEMAHPMSHTMPDDPQLSAADSEALTARWCSFLADQPPITAAPDHLPWEGHRAPFIRILCHLWARAERHLEIELPGEYLFDHQSYNLSALEDYRNALWAEIQISGAKRFSAILATRPPAAFVELWRDNVLDWGAEESDESRELAAADLLE